MSINVDNYVLYKLLGKGSYGEVFLSTKKGSNEKYATKRIDKKKMESMKKYLINEISILKRLNHKNIVKVEDVKQTKSHYYIMMEYCNGGGLMDCLKNYMKMYSTPFPEEIVQHLMRQIVSAIKYMHKRKIIHRDLKLDNILVKFEEEKDKKNLNMLKAVVKIIDFGFAIYLDSNGLAFSALGSPMNMDPLILNELNRNSNTLKGYDDKADIWSLGTLCYEMLIGRAPFYSKTVPGLVKNVEKGTYSLPLNLSKEVVSFLNGMIQYDPKKRLNASELSRHHFLVKNVKDFTPINLSKVINKLGGQGFNVNIKQNQTIWEEFNEEDKKVLNSINANMLKPLDTNEEILNNTDFNNDNIFFVNPNPFDFDNLPIKTEENINTVNNANIKQNKVEENLRRAKTVTNQNKPQQLFQSVNPVVNNNFGYGISIRGQIYDQNPNVPNNINIGTGKTLMNNNYNNNVNGVYNNNYNPQMNNAFNFNQSVNPAASKFKIPGADPDSYSFSSGIYPAKNEVVLPANKNMISSSTPINYNTSNYYGKY